MRRLPLILIPIVALLAACASTQASGNPDSSAGWSYTTGLGNTITLESAPEVIVTDAYSAAALWEYGIRPDAVFGYGLEAGGSELALGNADRDSMQVVGTAGDLNIEALAALEPDLIIGYGNVDNDQAWTWWDETMAERANAIAPFAGVRFSDRPIVEVIEEYAGLAAALGADVDNSVAAQAKTDFEDAGTELRTTLATKPELTTIALNGDAASLYAGTSKLSQLGLLEDLGAKLVGPASDEGWSEASWEVIPDYPADVVLSYVASTKAFAEAPVYRSLPAVKAEQVAPWDDKMPNTYAHYATWLNDLNTVYASAKDVTAG